LNWGHVVRNTAIAILIPTLLLTSATISSKDCGAGVDTEIDNADTVCVCFIEERRSDTHTQLGLVIVPFDPGMTFVTDIRPPTECAMIFQQPHGRVFLP
jgi:hypothetical protein